MGRVRVFLLKRRVRTLFRRIFRRHRSTERYRLLSSAETLRFRPVSRLINWAQHLRTKAKAIVLKKHYPDRVEEDPFMEKPMSVPKGHMAVYVGQEDGDFERIFVPVVYCNHPLFGDLLKKAEKEFGFNHPGGITIPCRISEFERIQTRIKEVQSPRKLLR